jgi:TolB-like protein
LDFAWKWRSSVCVGVLDWRPQPWAAKLRYLFEDFLLDTDQRELRRGENVLAVGPKVFDLLVLLAGNRERVISKDDLITAIWNGRVVSESALTSCINAARVALGDSGAEQRIIKTLPRKGVRFIAVVQDAPRLGGATGAAAASAGEPRPTLDLPDKPSIAVLPFQNMSGDPEQEYFADGMVEDIITALCRIKSLFVIARNSSFAYKGKAVDIKQVGRELGVRYLLEGSVRKAGGRVRITAQLIEAESGTHIWADRFDGGLEEAFEFQDKVTSAIAIALQPHVAMAEQARAIRKPTISLTARDLFYRALSYSLFAAEETREALRLCKLAIEADPSFADAHALAAMCHVGMHNRGQPHDEAEGTLFARRAVELAADDAYPLAAAAYYNMIVLHECVYASDLAERAVALNSNSAFAWAARGWAVHFLGRHEEAISYMHHVMRLSPIDVRFPEFFHILAWAHFSLKRYGEALSWAQKCLAYDPNHHVALLSAVVSLAALGRIDEAVPLVNTLRKRGFWSTLSVTRWPGTIEDQALFTDALRKAGAAL